VVVNEVISEHSSCRSCYVVGCLHACNQVDCYVCRSDIITALITKLRMTSGTDKLGMSLGMYIIIFSSYWTNVASRVFGWKLAFFGRVFCCKAE
jgi:hypothetical protein